jgi:hypothetical protein
MRGVRGGRLSEVEGRAVGCAVRVCCEVCGEACGEVCGEGVLWGVR